MKDTGQQLHFIHAFLCVLLKDNKRNLMYNHVIWRFLSHHGATQSSLRCSQFLAQSHLILSNLSSFGLADRGWEHVSS